MTLLYVKNLTKALILGLDLRQRYRLECDWSNSGKLYLQYKQNISVSNISTDLVYNLVHLLTDVKILATTYTAEHDQLMD